MWYICLFKRGEKVEYTTVRVSKRTRELIDLVEELLNHRPQVETAKILHEGILTGGDILPIGYKQPAGGLVHLGMIALLTRIHPRLLPGFVESENVNRKHLDALESVVDRSETKGGF